MGHQDPSVSDQYAVPELGERILAALVAAGKDIDHLSLDDLAPVDAFHIRGRKATEELMGWADIAATDAVLDIGSGLGGTCRYLSESAGCHATGVDLTDDYCRVAAMLSERVGMTDRTSFHTGSALELPFDDGHFDVVWTEHVQMNIEDKHGFYVEAARVLKPGGRFAFHDIVDGDGDTLFPAPWANDVSISHLIDPEGLRELLDGLGLVEVRWEDKTDASIEFFRGAIASLESRGWMPVGLHLLMGEDALEKFRNLLRNLEEGRVRVVQAVLNKPA